MNDEAVELPRISRLSAVQEALALWALCFALVVIAYVFVREQAKLVATVCFLYLPLLAMNGRGEDHAEYGVTFRRWREDLKLFLLLFGITVPLFTLAYVVYAELLLHLPKPLVQLISPYAGPWQFELRLPNRFGEWVVDQLLVVALPEEFFYRGFLLTRLSEAWPQGRTVLGVRVGRAFWVTAILFALGHLAIFEAWRLAVFFPALLFAWMRLRTGTVIGAALYHAGCNLLVKVLDASFYGRLG